MVNLGSAPVAAFGESAVRAGAKICSLFFMKHLSTSDTELLKMKRVLETLESSNDEKVQRDVSRSSGGSKGVTGTLSFCRSNG